ncbi:DUF4384 domain-containing protein [Aulosira sp. FACHB-615]|uniref:DUF4384 domain-containing protein n=1 Tax=Aulosira sp. FACHB-615 TaxID=2692777 RepID=UPI00168391FD|nr:DUF4384 domain-containing protein [Aulosira sp. FACHB-615]MBD2492194.1 DUF4384 domain-containing protein [Aulosira sp. FACHB-615]
MPRRTLVASPKGIEKAKYALVRKNWTQQALADDIQVASWATISKFFNGIPISYTIFTEICTMLELDWQDIALSSNLGSLESKDQKINPLAQLWEKLQSLGSPTEKMGLVLVKEETLGWGWEPNSRYEKSVSIGSFIRFEIDFDTPGYLLVIQKDTSEQVWCFCPSCFATQSHLNTGKTTLPQPGSPITSFPIEGTPGKEVVLAILTEVMPTLNWWTAENTNPLKLTENHLDQLIDFINENKNCRVLYTEYEIK